MAKRSNIVVARVSAVVDLDGKRHKIIRGKTTAHANHPIVKGRENLWRPLQVDHAVEEEEPKAEEPKKKPGPKPKSEPKPEPVEEVKPSYVAEVKEVDLEKEVK